MSKGLALGLELLRNLRSLGGGQLLSVCMRVETNQNHQQELEMRMAWNLQRGYSTKPPSSDAQVERVDCCVIVLALARRLN
jgi:hypothetical protein